MSTSRDLDRQPSAPGARRGVQPRPGHAPSAPGRHRDPAARRRDALEVLLVKRTPQARFMGGVWVFPGGAVDQAEGEDDRAHRAAAMRELHEEAGVELARPRGAGRSSRAGSPPPR